MVTSVDAPKWAAAAVSLVVLKLSGVKGETATTTSGSAAFCSSLGPRVALPPSQVGARSGGVANSSRGSRIRGRSCMSAMVGSTTANTTSGSSSSSSSRSSSSSSSSSATPPQWKLSKDRIDQLVKAGQQPSIELYNNLLEGYRAARKWEEANKLLVDMVHAAREQAQREWTGQGGGDSQSTNNKGRFNPLSDIRPNIVTYNAVLGALATAGKWKMALNVSSRLRSGEGGYGPPGPEEEEGGGGGGVSGGASDRKRGQQMVEEDAMEQDELEASEFVTINEEGEQEEEEDEQQQQQEEGQGPAFYTSTRQYAPIPIVADRETYQHLITACGVGNFPEKGVSLLDEMDSRGLTPDANCIAAAMIGLAALEDRSASDRALALLYHAKSSGVVPNERLFSAGMAACGGLGDWQTAVALLDEMRKVPIEATALSFGHVMRACSRGGNWKMALALLNTMKESGVTRSLRTYNIAMQACHTARKHNKVLDLLKEMQEDGIQPDVISYNIALAAMTKGTSVDLDRAAEFMDEARRANVRLDDVTNHTFLSACRRNRQAEPALRLLEHVRSTDPSAATEELHVQVMGACIAAARPSMAPVRSKKRGGKRGAGEEEQQQQQEEEQEEEEEEEGGGGGGRGEIIPGQPAMAAKALEIFEQLKAGSGSGKGGSSGKGTKGGRGGKGGKGSNKQPGLSAVTAALQAMALLPSDEALGTAAVRELKKLQERGVLPDPRAFSECMKVCNKCQQYKQTARLFKYMRTKSVERDAFSLGLAAEAFAGLGQSKGALEVYEEVQNLLEGRRTDGGKPVPAKKPPPGHNPRLIKPELLETIAHAMAADGLYREALTVLQEASARRARQKEEERQVPRSCAHEAVLRGMAEDKEWTMLLAFSLIASQKGVPFTAEMARVELLAAGERKDWDRTKLCIRRIASGQVVLEEEAAAAAAATVGDSAAAAAAAAEGGQGEASSSSSSSLPPALLNAALRSCISCGRADKGVAVLLEMLLGRIHCLPDRESYDICMAPAAADPSKGPQLISAVLVALKRRQQQGDISQADFEYVTELAGKVTGGTAVGDTAASPVESVEEAGAAVEQ